MKCEHCQRFSLEKVCSNCFRDILLTDVDALEERSDAFDK